MAPATSIAALPGVSFPMVEERPGVDLFDVHEVDALVNPVNCKGVMGKGIALEFKARFPESYKVYRAVCKKGELKPGLVLFVPGQDGEPNVLHFPTKNHWRGPSRLAWIETGLDYLKQHYAAWGLKRIVMPQLGCGLGGLEWRDVRPLIDAAFAEEPLQVIISTATTPRLEPRDSATTAPAVNALGVETDATHPQSDTIKTLAGTTTSARKARRTRRPKKISAEQLSLFPEES